MILIALIISGCAGTQQSGGSQPPVKTLVGGLGGAAAGGLIAAALHGGTAGIIGGVLAGGLIGGAIGDRMDAADRREAQKASQQALEKAPSGTAIAWHNPDNGHSGTVKPVRTFQKSSGQYCREYQQTVTIGDQTLSLREYLNALHNDFDAADRDKDGTLDMEELRRMVGK